MFGFHYIILCSARVIKWKAQTENRHFLVGLLFYIKVIEIVPTRMKILYLFKYVLIAVALSSLGVTVSYAKDKDPARVIVGWLEHVRIEEQDFEVKAKLDSGAKTASIHALNIESFKKGNKFYVKFDLPLTDKHGELQLISLEKPIIRKVKIKDHNGKHDRRYVVKLDMCFNGKNYSVEFNLVDRSEFNYNILLGRRFLGKVAIIDPLHTFLTTNVCK